MGREYFTINWLSSFTFLLLFPFFSHTTELAPWFGNLYEVEARVSTLYQKFQHVNSSKHSFSYRSNDFFTNFSLSVSPDPDFSVETEVLFADTRHRNYGFDSAKLTGRYQILDDIIGDPVSLTTGLSIIVPLRSALRDIGSFHHGMAEFEAHVAVGVELPYLSIWLQRQYGVFACGIATQGSPWLRVGYYFERNFCNSVSVQIFLDSLFGLGRRTIHKHDFNGYGAVAHRSIDAGLKWSYLFDYWGTLSLEYAYRIYARNFPRNVNFVQFSYNLPFNL